MEPSLSRLLAAPSSLSARRQLGPSAPRCLRCALFSSSIRSRATPLPHPNTPGPPPEPPAASVLADRAGRKRELAEKLRQSQQAKTDPSKPKSVLRKRFWKEASVRESPEGLQVYLDSRPVRAASKQVLTLSHSKRALAGAIAAEWDTLVSAQQALKQHYIPLTSLTSRAIDIKAADAAGNSDIRETLIRQLMRYLLTDTLLCWAPTKNLHDPEDGQKTLRQQQIDVAEPIIAFLTTHVFPGVDIAPILADNSIVPSPQPQMTQEVVRGWMTGLPAFELAALERAIFATKSFCIGVRLLVEWSPEYAHLRKNAHDADGKERFGIEQAVHASSVEVAYQTQRWGEVEDTHDVDAAMIRQQLGSVILLVT